MAGVFRRVTGFFSRSSSRRANRVDDRETKAERRERKKTDRQKKKKKTRDGGEFEEDDAAATSSGPSGENDDVSDSGHSGSAAAPSPTQTKSSKQTVKSDGNVRHRGKDDVDGRRPATADKPGDGRAGKDGGESRPNGGEGEGSGRSPDTARTALVTAVEAASERDGIAEEGRQHSALVHANTTGRHASAEDVQGESSEDDSEVDSDDDDDDAEGIQRSAGDEGLRDDSAPIMGKRKKNNKRHAGKKQDIVAGGGGDSNVDYKDGLSNSGFTTDEISSSQRDDPTFTESQTSSQLDGLASSVVSGSSIASSAMDGPDSGDAGGDGGQAPGDKGKQKRGMRDVLRNKISSTLHHMDLEKSDPEFVVSVMAIPTVQTFSSVKKKLRNSNQEWMQGFLDNEGLERLLDCVDTFANRRVTALSDAYILIECVECIKAVLNSKIGLSLLVQKPEYSRRLIKAMDTNNAMVKKQVVELLSALCMYSVDGYKLAMDALETFKTMKQMRYRFSLIINELKSSELTPYRTTLMAFINCILCACDDLHERNRIRNEFVGLNLLDIIPDLRNFEDKELDIQCDVFDDFKNDDDEELALCFSESVDINNHRELFDVIFNKVYNTPLSDKFLTILQTLLQIDLDTQISDVQWELMEQAAQTAIIIDNDNSKHTETPSLEKLLLSRFRNSSDNLHQGSSGGKVMISSFVQTDLDMSSVDNAPLWSPPPQTFRPILTPKPKQKMKTFNWSKIPAQSMSNEDNIWKEVLEMQDKVEVKYDTIEQLFCQKAVETKVEEPTKVKPPTEVNLLDMKRSMNANIFLKQFSKMTHADIVGLIRDGDSAKIGAERLRGLQKILPDKDEVMMIQNYDGDVAKLGNAEKFFLQLSKLSGYKIRVEGMLLKDDFRVAMDALLPNVNVMIKTCNQIMENTSLKGFLRYVLHAGNFINAGGYAGNALGFKIASLNKLMDTRANKPRVTLLHYLVEEAGKEQDEIMEFADQLLPTLTEASRLTVDNLTSETKQLEGHLRQLKDQVANSENDIKEYFAEFIKEAESQVNIVHRKLAEIKDLTHALAVHFCEPENTFKLEECLSNFNVFCQKVKQCRKDNEQRKIQEERAEKRRKENEAMKANKGSKEPKSPQEEDGCIIDNLLKDIRKGFKLRKTTSTKRKGSLKLNLKIAAEPAPAEVKLTNGDVSEKVVEKGMLDDNANTTLPDAMNGVLSDSTC
ncbi:unnamed protein product [Lymnaea stagnalis]|uniref:Inverted formin-2 n=1 Tax=Lymnaea stagnalis TaxID=6523 RepID=A0AAV2HQY0_LYMST